MIEFTKMQGCGNDYVYINGFTQKIDSADKPEWVRKISDRHFGVGSDGAIFINPSKIADFEMEMWNADGTRSEMCGNGIRCVGKYVYDKGLTDKTELTVESFGKIKYLTLYVSEGKVDRVRVNMGAPELIAERIPVVCDKEQAIDEPIEVQGKTYHMTCVSMGNPHAVVFLPEIDSLDLEKMGPSFEHHPLFPNRVNTEFIRVIDDHTLQMRVWERGSGETFACGTGACAAAVASVLNGYCKREQEILIHLRGGDLRIIYHNDESVTMIGPATFIFEGKMEYPV